MTRASQTGLTRPATRWARVIAAARRRTVDSFNPRRASDVRYSAAVCGSAGSAARQ